MNDKYNKRLISLSKNLRNAMTKEEKHIWYDFLKQLPQTFNRQKVIGEYIVDFYCANAKIVVEIDGSQHGTLENREYDQNRTNYLNSIGITVLRYSNDDIHKRFREVCLDILKHL